jgi:hypothetical protein
MSFFEVMNEFQRLAKEYPTLSIDWWAEDGKWLSWPPPARAVREGEKCPSLPGSDDDIVTNADEAGKRLLGPAESWFNPGHDPWLDFKEKEPWERWLYAIREFWLNAAEETEDAGTDTAEFAKTAEALGYLPTHGAQAVGERVWRKMVQSKKSLQNALQELGLSAGDTISQYEEPAGWVQTGCIKQVFKASAYFCGVLAARRALELEKASATRPIEIKVDGAVATQRQIHTPGLTQQMKFSESGTTFRTRQKRSSPIFEGWPTRRLWR